MKKNKEKIFYFDVKDESFAYYIKSQVVMGLLTSIIIFDVPYGEEWEAAYLGMIYYNSFEHYDSDEIMEISLDELKREMS